MSSPVFTRFFGKTCNLVMYILTELLQIGRSAVQEVDTHGDGAHIEVLLLYHLVGFDNLRYIDHTFEISLLIIN